MIRASLSLFLIGLVHPSFESASAGESPRSAVPSRSVRLTLETRVTEIPDEAEVLELWIPVPQDDAHQTIHRLKVESPVSWKMRRESEYGNRMLHVKLTDPPAELRVAATIDATRRENSGRNEPLSPAERWRSLAAEPLVPLDGPIRDLALHTAGSLKSDTQKARALFDEVVHSMTYDKSGTGWGRGDALYACEAKRGNCTDFHALLIGMARSIGIPARFAIGLPLPPNESAGAIPGYHCWAELYVEGLGWVPVDASEAAKHPERRDYFFGHHDPHRLEFSRGRNLELEPLQQGPRLNFFIDAYVEVDGRPHVSIEHRYRFHDLEPEGSEAELDSERS